MDKEHSIENTKKYAILEVMFFNGYSVGMQSFVLLSLAIYFNMSSFFISIVSSLPTAGYLLQIFTKRVNLLLGSRKRTMVIAATVSRLVICVMPFAVFFDIRRQEVYFAVMFIYALVSPFSNNVWTAVMTKIVDKKERGNVEIIMGPNIKPFPVGEKLQDSFTKKVILKTKDNITTDDICPSNAALLPFRSNIPKLSEHCFQTIIPDFKERAEKNNGGIIVGGDNYGQGSSREHAALLPLYLGIKAVIAKSFARIHKANLINSGILPLEFISSADYDSIDEYDELELTNIKESLEKGEFIVKNKTKNTEFKVKFNGSERELKILGYGGYLSFAMSDEF